MGSSGIKSYYKQHKKKIGINGGITKPSPKIRSNPPSVPVQDQEKMMRKRKEAEEELREFDMDSRYGPAVGLMRMERWDRASAMGLFPPANLESLLLLTEIACTSSCLWHGRV